MHFPKQHSELFETMRRLSQDIGAFSNLTVEYLDVLLACALGPLDQEQQDVLDRMGSCAQKLASIASNYDQIFATEHAQKDVQFEQAELDDRCSRLLEYPAYLAHESRSFLSAIHGLSKILLDKIYAPLNEQQKERIGEIDGLAQTLMVRIQMAVDTAKALQGRA